MKKNHFDVQNFISMQLLFRKSAMNIKSVEIFKQLESIFDLSDKDLYSTAIEIECEYVDLVDELCNNSSSFFGKYKN